MTDNKKKFPLLWFAFLLLSVQVLRTEFKSVDQYTTEQHRHADRHQRQSFEINEIDPAFRPVIERKAMEHSAAVSSLGACDVPKEQVVHVSDHYPDTNKYYLPHCTVLHRCGKHAGCCGTDKLRCVASKKEKVTLYFYSVKVLGQGLPAEHSIEKLLFTNHTKCGCIINDSYKNDL